MAVWSSMEQAKDTVEDWFWSLLLDKVIWPYLKPLVFGGTLLFIGGMIIIRNRSLPLGPWGIPWIGIHRQLNQPLHMECLQMCKTYKSDIVSFNYYGQLTIVLHGYKLVKEALSTRGAELDERPILPLMRAGFTDEIIFESPSKQPAWSSNKKFAMGLMRSHGYGNMATEGKIHLEYNKLLEFLKVTKGKPVDLAHPVEHALARVMTSIVYSSNYGPDDPEVELFIALIREMFTLGFCEDLLLASMLPEWLMNAVNPEPMQKSKEANDRLKQFILDKVNDHRQTLDKKHPRDIVDAYLIARDGPEVDDHTLAFTLLIFLIDAIETLHFIAMAGILHITANPEVQDTLRQELNEVVGSSGQPSLSHKEDLKYLQASIFESLRVANPNPLGVEHSPKQVIQLKGYKIPPGCSVFANIYGIHMDPELFPNPGEFNPRHFLNEDGDIINSEYCISFSLGKRSCMGEQMAKMELFLLFARIFHEFRLSFPPEGRHLIEMQQPVFVVQEPPRFEVCAEQL